jgi:RNA polymerase sigma-70 factor (ECF subfamily)
MKSLEIKEQFKEVYENEVDALFRFCALRVGNREQVVDIVQDVFVELWQIYQKGEKVKNARALLYTILRHKIIDWYRKKKAISLDAMTLENKDGEEYAYDPKDPKADTDIVFSAEARRMVEAIDKLGTSYREIVYLRLVEDLSPPQIAKKLHFSINKVSVRITRGLEKLRRHYNTGEF